MQPVAFDIPRGPFTIRGQYILPAPVIPGERCPAVFLSHCFGGNYDSMVRYAAPFLELGYAAFLFDFCGGGIVCRSSGCHQDITFAGECADLIAVIKHACSLPFVDADRIALVGESLGGVISAMVAAQGTYPVSQLILISPAFCAPDDARQGRFGGAVYPLDAVPEIIRCPNGMRVSRRLHEEAAATDIWSAVCSYQGPGLLIHGTDDPVVPCRYAVEAASRYANMQLHLMQQMGHCSMNDEQLDNTLRLMRLYLCGKHEVLDIDVQVTGAERLRNDLTRPAPDEDLGGNFICAVYFTGTTDSPAFRGVIAEGGVDRQTIRNGKMVRLCAEYTLVGTDGLGHACEIHIVNSGIDGNFKPIIHTNSPMLRWMNDADLTAVLEMRPQGPAISIWG